MSHDSLLLDEITRREVIEFVEEEDDVMDCSDDDDPVSLDGESDLDSSKVSVDENE
jgi:hypothetical protein